MGQIPQTLVNFRAYAGAAAEYLGLTDVELPAFESMVETIAGAGMAGEMSAPILGHFQSMTVKLKWRAPTPAAIQLLAPIVHVLDIRGSVQVQDSIAGALLTQSIRVECTGQGKRKGFGKLEMGKPLGSDFDLEVTTIRISIDDIPLVELDKLNMIFKVGGVDYLAKIRRDVGGV